MLPYDFFKTVVLEEKSNALVENRFMVLGEGEFLWYIGLKLLMSTCSGWSRNDFGKQQSLTSEVMLVLTISMLTCPRGGLMQ